jgi:hypothetical protein
MTNIISLSERINIKTRQNELSNLIRNITDHLSDDNNDLPACISDGQMSKIDYLETLMILEQELKEAPKNAATLRELVFNIEELKIDYQKIIL